MTTTAGYVIAGYTMNKSNITTFNDLKLGHTTNGTLAKL